MSGGHATSASLVDPDTGAPLALLWRHWWRSTPGCRVGVMSWSPEPGPSPPSGWSGSAFDSTELLGALPPAWRCFHCDETFADREAARLHFGDGQAQRALCTIDAAHFRWMEAQLRRFVDEDSEALRALAGLAMAHEQLRREAEEQGYERGLRDARKHPGELGLQPVAPRT